MLPPITANSNVEVKESCNCCHWPWKRSPPNPFKVRGHRHYTIVERVHDLAIKITESNK